MFWKMLLLFTMVPLLELALLIQIGQWIGVIPTVLLVFVTGVVGATLARSQGLMVIRDFQVTVKRAQVPAIGMIEGLLIVIGGALLLTPGLITDIVGFSFIIPSSRRLVALYLADYLASMVKKKFTYHEREKSREDFYMDIEWEEDE